jgi:hypothetical protein
MEVVVELSFPAGEPGSIVAAHFGVASATPGVRSEAAEVSWTFASHRDNDDQPGNAFVDWEVALQFATRARAEATEFNRNDEFERARRVLLRTARRIEAYAGDDTELRNLAKSLREGVSVYAEGVMSLMELKKSFYLAEATSRGRDRYGRAKR